jgi:hypothetical protein
MNVYGTLAQVAFWSVMLPLIVGHFFVAREPVLYVGLLWGLLAEGLLAVILGYYWLALAFVLIFMMQFMNFMMSYELFQDSYQKRFGMPKQHLPGWLRDTPNLDEKLTILDAPISQAVIGEIIDKPRPGDLPTTKSRRTVGYHRPEVVIERTGEVNKLS